MVEEDVYLRKLELHTNEVLKKNIYKDLNIRCCPICGSEIYIKYGSYKGIQRYKCKKCNKTFSNTTNSLWSYSKKNPKLWIEFLELMIEKKSLRFCAEKLNINLVTAFYWRHKVLHALTLDSTPDLLRGIIYINKVIIKENFKGCRNIEVSAKTNRRKNIWILAAKGEEDSMFVQPIFKDFWDWKIFYEKVYSRVEKNSHIISYGDRYLFLVSQKHNKKSSAEIEDDNRIKYFILGFENWFAVFRGVASKYLQRYLSFFILFNLDKVVDYIDIMYNILFFGNKFMKTARIRGIENYIY